MLAYPELTGAHLLLSSICTRTVGLEFSPNVAGCSVDPRILWRNVCTQKSKVCSEVLNREFKPLVLMGNAVMLVTLVILLHT